VSVSQRRTFTTGKPAAFTFVKMTRAMFSAVGLSSKAK